MQRSSSFLSLRSLRFTVTQKYIDIEPTSNLRQNIITPLCICSIAHPYCSLEAKTFDTLGAETKADPGPLMIGNFPAPKWVNSLKRESGATSIHCNGSVFFTAMADHGAPKKIP